MSDFFYRNYQSKTCAQLENIIQEKDRYQRNAVKAAIRILNERNETDYRLTSVAKGQIDTNHDLCQVSKTRHDKGFFEMAFNIKVFKTTIGSHDIFSWLALALFALSCLEILIFYSDESIMERHSGWIFFLVVFIVLISNHILFKIEHKISNNVLGRLIHDFCLIILFFLFRNFYNWLIKDYDLFYFDDIFALLFVVVLITFTLEFFVAILKRFLLTLFKWEIL
jgi:hypothetical protein